MAVVGLPPVCGVKARYVRDETVLVADHGTGSAVFLLAPFRPHGD